MLRAAVLAVAAASVAAAQLSPSMEAAVIAPTRYQVHSNLVYSTIDGHENRLDVFRRRDAAGPHPAMIYIHGGGWTSGFKEDGLMYTLPWLEMGWSVVNVEYRLAKVAPAPAAVEDCLTALRWIVAHAAQYRIDPKRLVVMGDSAGGHLALMAGMSETGGGSSAPLPKVAAVVNWYGITDVADLLQGPNRRGYAVEWLANVPDKEAVAKQVSPLAHVRAGLPPIITIHGDADPTVPYSHGVRLTEALVTAHVPARLITIPGGVHGGFPAAERIRAYVAIREFLTKNKVF